ncbi:hypothetical protein B296_00029524 [Ensete ventricosum]|uniref:Uncharacterized protein n=1 Tax=Ensete ventricosum TaxID=4639 RepID=A0A426Z6E4_ENSVE|nr:hypothetical protein B296_00029524 [Ensete ventricosum]
MAQESSGKKTETRQKIVGDSQKAYRDTIAPPPLPPATVVATLNIFLLPTSSFPLTSIPSSFARRSLLQISFSHRCSTTITFTPCHHCYHPHLLPAAAAVVATAFLYRKDLSLPSLPPTTMHNGHCNLPQCCFFLVTAISLFPCLLPTRCCQPLP